MSIAWWHWLALGLVLIALELAATGGFYIIFVGVAASLIALLSLAGLAGPVWMQLLLFSALSVGSLLLFRRRLLHWLKLDAAATDVDSLVGETAIALEDMSPRSVGRVELRGTVWSARNISNQLLPRGSRCTVVRVDRLMLLIEAEGVHS